MDGAGSGPRLALQPGPAGTVGRPPPVKLLRLAPA